MDKLTNKAMADKIGLPLLEQRLGYGLTNNPNVLMTDGVKYITVHQTGNTSEGADADNHHRYLRNNSNGEKTSWHYTVDEVNAIQSFRDERVLWHGGDGNTGEGNRTSVAIEMCIDADKAGEAVMGVENYTKTIKHAQKLVAILMVQHNIPIENVVQHNKWNGKDCPMQVRKGLYGINWARFINGVKDEHTALMKALQPTPVETKAPEGKLYRVALGAYGIRENAEAVIAEANEKGFSPYLVIVDDPNYEAVGK